MKVERVSIEPDFKPVSINLTFETDDELIAFYLIMNYRPAIDADGVDGFLDVSMIRGSILESLNPETFDKKWKAFVGSTQGKGCQCQTNRPK
jgi:hypothetical protein